MKQLELKHLAPYLPYKLKIKYFDRNVVMNAGTGSSTNWIGITALIQRQDKKNCLPILRPLSDLTKEIEHNGERFVPVDKIMKIFSEYMGAHIHRQGLLVADLTTISNPPTETLRTYLIQFIPKFVLEKLFEWYFDVFGLIGAGLAISKEDTPLKQS